MQSMKPLNPFDTVDPSWAWAGWEPSASEPWDTARAAHLYRRSAFGADSQTISAAVESSLEATLDRIMGRPNGEPQLSDASNQLASSVLAANDSRGLSAWWLYTMLNSSTPCAEKMTLFWHGHFATGAEKVQDAQLMFDQNCLLRTHALGRVPDLVHGIAKDPAMLNYLDSAVNRKAHPNENFARELMELFCLGEGNYSEKDVQELARCFTGWEIKRKQFRFNPYQHDEGAKQLLGASDIESGDQAVDAVLASPHAPRFMVGKLFRFFIADEPAPPAALLEPLARQLVTDDWHIASVVRTMLRSRLMYSPMVRGRKVRSPVDWALNWINACEITTNLKKLSQALNELGQTLFYPPNVKGWDGGRAWINSSTLIGRTNLINQLLRDDSTRLAAGDLETFFRGQRITSIEALINWLERQLLANPLTTASRERLNDAMMAAGGIKRIADCLVLAASLPEFQLA